MCFIQRLHKLRACMHRNIAQTGACTRVCPCISMCALVYKNMVYVCVCVGGGRGGASWQIQKLRCEWAKAE